MASPLSSSITDRDSRIRLATSCALYYRQAVGDKRLKIISICIITCDRASLLREAIYSCVAQNLPPDEVIIGDDSLSNETEQLISSLRAEVPFPLSYRHHKPKLGQNANVNSVFERAMGTHLLLLHDDDTLLPNALEDLAACWDLHPDLTAAYGKQYVISHDGSHDFVTSESFNAAYRRTSEDAGLQSRPWMVGLTQQFPNDGYMIEAKAAKDTLWRSHNEVGYGAEFDFGLRLGLRYSKFFFVDKYTANYRETVGSSITHSASDDASLQAYRILSSASLPPAAEPLREERLRDLAPLAVRQAARQGKRQEALSIFWSTHLSWRRRISPNGLRTLSFIIRPS